MAKTSVKRRTKPTRAPRAAKARPKQAKARRKQTFVVSHLDARDFKAGGLRDYVEYRDLGVSRATNGLVLAHVLRFCKPCDPKVVAKEHLHDVVFQMVYVLEGWIKTELDRQGAHVMKAGDAWIQPPRIKHRVLDYSDDCELLEIVMPAEFETVELE
jgi:mannose-6-phosphate isomerase-like protein (cupin superfamily)